MRNFELYIDDDRYFTPTLIFVQMSDEQRVRDLARRKLAETPHHRGIEVREDGARIFALGTMAEDDAPAAR